MDRHMDNRELVYGYSNNFLFRARSFLVHVEFVTAITNSTELKDHIRAAIDDLKRRFPTAQIYLMGTSNGTHDTMALADYLSGRIAGQIHPPSLQQNASFDARKYHNRQLIAHHRQVSCRRTPFSAAEVSHDHYRNDFIALQGGTSAGAPCKALTLQGCSGVERETIEAIKKWIKQNS